MTSERDRKPDPARLDAVDDALRALGQDLRAGRLAASLRHGDFTVLRLLGEGATSEVFLALRARGTPETLAIKILKPGVDGREVVGRFERERLILDRLAVRGVVSIEASGVTEDGRPWFAMPFIDGPDCVRAADALRLPLRMRLELFAEICETVAAAHAAGVLHRDLKPGNILCTAVRKRLQPAIVDFGIARAADVPSKGLTPAGVAHRLGTPAFMPPEQRRFGIGACDARSDIFALGMVLGVLAAGVVPRVGEPADAATPSTRRKAPGRTDAPSAAFARRMLADRTAADEAARQRALATAPDLFEALREAVDPLVLHASAMEPAERPADAASLARLVRAAAQRA